MSTVRTRFAPSPTGYMHVGNLRTALYTYLQARHNGGTFILRIEDTDQGRLVEGATDIIYGTLKATGLTWDEGPDVGGPVGPYVQSQRMGMFKQYAEQLVKAGKAYYCFCTEERLNEMHEAQRAAGEMTHYDGHCRHLSAEEVAAKLAAGEPYVIRQKIPESGVAGFDDVVYGHIEVDVRELDDQILIKTDGMPTYNFANVVDDHLMGITHVIRGSEYLSSTPKYNLLYDAFGWEKPVYIHCPPVMKDAQNKLSKRNGDASYQDLVAKGYLPAAVLNYLLLLGWAPEGEQEIFSLDEMIKMLNDNPNVTIELGAHTDRKGTDQYNERLAQRRAQSVVDYLIAGGIEAARLEAKGYGESVPKTINKKMAKQFDFLKEGDVLTEEFILALPPEQQEIADQINRRTEFKVLRTNYNLF